MNYRGVEIVYFHGMPGTGNELALFRETTKQGVLNVYVPTRAARTVNENALSYFDHIADRMRSKYSRQNLHLIGFSLGAVAALQVAARLGDQVSQIDLISAAAPLSTGNYLDKMPSKAIFSLAANRQEFFSVFVKLQGLLSRFAPNAMFDILFRSACGLDAAFKNDAYFKSQMRQILNACLTEGLSGYKHEILYYVDDWVSILSLITQPVFLWHGRLDNWSPPEMADKLAALLIGSRPINWINDASHYSALRAYLSSVDCPISMPRELRN